MIARREVLLPDMEWRDLQDIMDVIAAATPLHCFEHIFGGVKPSG